MCGTVQNRSVVGGACVLVVKEEGVVVVVKEEGVVVVVKEEGVVLVALLLLWLVVVLVLVVMVLAMVVIKPWLSLGRIVPPSAASNIALLANQHACFGVTTPRVVIPASFL